MTDIDATQLLVTTLQGFTDQLNNLRTDMSDLRTEVGDLHTLLVSGDPQFCPSSAAVAVLREDFKDLKGTVGKQGERVDSLESTRDTTAGARGIIGWLITTLLGIGALLSSLWQHFHPTGK